MSTVMSRLTSCKVLESVLVINGIRRVGLGELKHFGEIFGKVRDDRVGDLGHVEHSVAAIIRTSPVSRVQWEGSH